MTIEIMREALLWCTVINFGGLVLWILVFSLLHDWMYRLHGRWFRVPVEQLDAIHYTGMVIYKIGIILFNLVPYIALLIVT